MNYTEHYSIDNNLMEYNDLTANERGRMNYRYRMIRSLVSKGSTLDIGSADGYICKNNSDDFFSVDISQINNTHCKLKIEGDALSLPIKSDNFNNAIISETLEHITNVNQCISEINRILKVDGTLIISVPYNEKRRFTLCVHCNKETPLNAHLHSFKPESINKILYKNGFTVERTIFYENKLLNYTAFFKFSHSLPLFIIKSIDLIANTFFNKYNKMIIIAKKGQ